MSLINPGDSVLFKRGDSFTGKILLTKSGVSGSRIVFSSYGEGRNPIIKGTLPLTNWIRHSGNVWRSDSPELGPVLSGLLINGKSMPIGRYPNADATNKGYLTIDSHSGRTSITSSSLSGYNWTGAEAVVRTKRWVLDRVAIQSHQGSTINFNSSTSYEITDKFGFFIQNHINTLDRDGEWCYNSSLKRIYLYSLSDPNTKITEVSNLSSVFEASNVHYFTIQNFEFIGSVNSALFVSNSSHFEINNNKVSMSGNIGIHIRSSSSSNITYNNISNSNNNAILVSGSQNMTVRNNNVKVSGIKAGMGGSSNGQYLGMFLNGTGISCEYNTIDSVGYIGIFFEGNDITIKNNVISNFCSVMDDGGAIYTWSNTNEVYSNRNIEGNIILNGIGAGEGTNDPSYKAAEGIYIDGHSNHIAIVGNTIANCANNGIYIHNSNNISILNNTSFNNNCQILINHDSYEPAFPIRNCSISNNIFFSKTASQLVASFQTIKDDLSQFGTIDNNYYCRPLKEDLSIFVLYTGTAGRITKFMDLKEWQTISGKDRNSKISPVSVPTYVVTGLVGSDKITNGTFVNGITGWSCFSNYNNGNATWDNTNKLDGGSLKLSFLSPLNRNDGYLTEYSGVGSVIRDRNYILRFSMISSTSDKKIKVEMREGVSPFSSIAEGQNINSTQSRKECELLFRPNQSSTNARIHFAIDESGDSYWFDNVQLYEANVNPTNVNEWIEFVYNTSTTSSTFGNGNYYFDPKGNRYSSVTLQPYSSIVLIKDPDQTTGVTIPQFVSSSIENASPSRLEINFDIALANIVPAASAFTVMVNSTARTVSSVAVSGTRVTLTLSSPVAYGNTVTVAYTRPSANPLQTSAGGIAASFSARQVTNRVAQPAPTAPVYVSSAIENATPARLDINFDLAIANIVPAASAFTVMVNSTARTVSSVAVSGTRVTLTLSSPVAYGNTVTVAYTRPSANPLQTSAGGYVASFSARQVTNRVAQPAPAVPAYISSVIENATPTRLEISFDLALTNIVPAVSAFTVMVNSTARTVSSVAVSGTRVTLSLSSPVAYGNTVTIAYNRPSANPLQTSAGGYVASFSARQVTNKVAQPAPTAPVYVSSAIENANPARLDINFDLALTNIVPAVSAFTVMVNSTARTVSSVVVSGTRVTLTLSSPVAYGNTVTVAYTRPSTNPLQTAAGGQAGSIGPQAVTNKVAAINNPPVVVVNYQKSVYSGFVYTLNATGSYDQDKDNLSFSWTTPSGVPVSSTSGPIIKFLGPAVNGRTTLEFIANVSDGKTTQSKSIPIEIVPYKPELEVAEVIKIEASSYYSQNYPYNVIDRNIGTMWCANGIDEWLIVELKEPFSVGHVELAFQSGQIKESYFDILGSADKVSWEPVLIKSASCGFSGDIQVFDFPASKSGREFKYIKLAGSGNEADEWNYISELRVLGHRFRNPGYYENLSVKLYPNPASEIVNIKIDEPDISFDFIRIVNFLGEIVYHSTIDDGTRDLQIPVHFQEGIYLVQMGYDNITLHTSKLIVLTR